MRARRSDPLSPQKTMKPKPAARRPGAPKPRFGQRHQARPPRAPETDGPLRLYGVHAVEAALQNPHRTVTRLLMTENAENRLGAALAGRNPERVSPRDLSIRNDLAELEISTPICTMPWSAALLH